MGMAVGERKHGVVSDPNIVPLIDVLLVLIIIFMVITPQVSSGLRASLPQPAPPHAPADQSPIVVEVMSGGKLLINGEPADWTTLGDRLATIFKLRATKVAFIQGTDDIPFAQVALAIDIMRQAGIDHVALMMQAAVAGH
jgi:biopolymer transport protein ExbD